MKVLFLLTASIFFGYFSFSQQVKDSQCTCIKAVNINFPDLPDDDSTQGTVIVVYEIDSVCFAGKPRIIQSLALRLIRKF